MDIRKPQLWSDHDVTVTEAAAFQNIQGYALVGHGKPRVCLAVLTYTPANADAVHLALAEYGSAATTALDLYQSYVAHQQKEESPTVDIVKAVGLTKAGLVAFPGGQVPWDAGFNDGFRQQPPRLGAIVVLAGAVDKDDNPTPALTLCCKELDRKFSRLATVQWEIGDTRKRPLDFKDGISQPVFFEKEKLGNTYQAYDPSATLGLVLTPQPGATDEYGSFMAYVKFRFDEKAFAESVDRAQKASGRARPEVESWFMGRDSETSKPLASAIGTSLNDFNYSGQNSALCPLGAHIRTMNPRLPGSRSNRVLRRAAVYQVGEETGLLFQCFQSELRAGFGKLFDNWATGLGTETDAILTARDSAPRPAASGLNPLPPSQPAASVVEGEYFYFPSIPFFRRALQK